MYIGRILAPVHSLGPGDRICIWTQGCKKDCDGCISPELRNEGNKEVSVIKLIELVQLIAEKKNCTGLTISGGDPFEQPESLYLFLKNARKLFDDILVYTGFEIEEIRDGVAGDFGKHCLDFIDVLIDGRYIKSLNTSDCVLRGSSNQIIHYLNEKRKTTYIEYMKSGRIIEKFVDNNGTIITGILSEV